MTKAASIWRFINKNILKENICSLYVPKRTRSLVKNKEVFKPLPILRDWKGAGIQNLLL
jgi:hypothetical protein